ncbi:alpha/beta fold hydrolase [Roseovarius arcticus]|uniref:alpha/beta fold hydrolase n=1 Tax=Roseovarius arcticus TaxID=2547404 RepID=UPI00111099E7|nr:alpha/beta hydrolase [Roseovarius arcticus]
MTWTTRQRSKTGSIAAISVGEGSLVLMIHGVGLRAEAWAAQIDELSKAHRVVAVDIPGHGESAALKSRAQMADFTDAIAAVLDAPAVVVGHSFGAMIAMDMATRYPDRVIGVAALNAIYRRDPAAKSAVLARADSLGGAAVADPGATLARWFGDAPSPQRDACHGWLSGVDPAGYRDAYRAFAREDGPSNQELRDMHCPVLFLTGGREPNSTPEMSQQMAVMVKDGRAEVVDGAAHMLPMTHASEVNVILADFLKERTT